MKRLAIITGGGDAPGLNAAIRSIVLAGLKTRTECFGVRDGFDGLLTPDGGIGAEVARELQRLTCKEARFDVLGHLQRGGPPSMADRILATRFGVTAFSLAHEETYGVMVALRSSKVHAIPLADVQGRTQAIPRDHSFLTTARRMGIVFGA